MKRRASILLILCLVVVGGTLAAHTAFAIYKRSDSYVALVAQHVSDFFELPTDIGAAESLTFYSEAFDSVDLWLPDRRDRVFHCDRAVWSQVTEPSGSVYELDLKSGVLALGTDKWLLEDYRTVLESGLRQDFDDIRRLRLEDFAISFRRKSLLLSCDRADGTITFDSPELGIASLQAYVLNGQPVAEPVRIHARFLPHGQALVESMILTIPEVSLAGLGLDAVFGEQVTRGHFSGRLEYRDASPDPWIDLAGRLEDIDLFQLTKRLPIGAIHGRADLTLQSARFSGLIPIHVQGRARLTGIELADFAPLIGFERLSGNAVLSVPELDIADGRINRMVITGRVEGVDLADLVEPLGRGRVTGKLSVVVHSLHISDDRVVSADIDIQALPVNGVAGTIDREMFLAAAEQFGGLALPDAMTGLLPDQIEYSQFGVRLLVTDNRLRVIGTHGPEFHTVLSIKLLGQEWGVLKEWGTTLDLTPFINSALERIRSTDPRQVPQWLRDHQKSDNDK